MNRIDASREAAIDKMLCSAYPIRVICEVVGVARGTVGERRVVLSQLGAMGLIYCACGRPVVDDFGNWHDIQPCKKRQRRSRLLLHIIRSKRKSSPTTAAFEAVPERDLAGCCHGTTSTE